MPHYDPTFSIMRLIILTVRALNREPLTKQSEPAAMNTLVYADLLAETLKKHAHLPCLHIKRKGVYTSWTYDEFHRDLNRLASLLKRNGCKPGVNGVVIGENSPEWIIAYHAILLTGACTVPIDPNIPASEVESIVTTTQARVVFCSRVYLGLFRHLQSRHSFIKRIVLLDTETEEKELRFDQYIAHGNARHDVFNRTFAPDDPMVILFTSGTTGKAKGAVLCQKNFTAVCKHAVPRMKITSDDTVCAVLPLHHVFGFAASVVGPLYAGMDIVCVPFLKGPLILEALKDKAITYLPAVPKLLQLFYDSILHNVKKKGAVVQTAFSGLQAVSATVGDRFGEAFKRRLFGSVHKGFGGSLRLIISGGAALNKTYWNGFRRLGFTIVEGYGLTETFGPITVCPGDKPRLGSVGPVLPENEIKILEPDHAGIGEVLLRGTCVFSGYYENDAMTREVIDPEGWFHSGDLGRVDSEGYLFLAGRKKDVIVLDTGKNVYPDELEDYYGTSPLIEEIGVFGISQGSNEMVAAAIVPETSLRRTTSPEGIHNLIQADLVRLAKDLPVHRRIADFVISFSPLPRTTTRKLKKNELRSLYHDIKHKKGPKTLDKSDLSVMEMAMMESIEYGRVLEHVIRASNRIRPEKITPRSNLQTELHFDSFRRAELHKSIQTAFSITIPPMLFDKAETMGEIVSLVRDFVGDSNS
jgi:long-chain acyl-CoA synthetase